MSPERLRAKPYDNSSDIWSVGLVLLECFTRVPPWQQSDSIVALVISVEESTAEETIPDALSSKYYRELLFGCLQLRPGMYNHEISTGMY